MCSLDYTCLGLSYHPRVRGGSKTEPYIMRCTPVTPCNSDQIHSDFLYRPLDFSSGFFYPSQPHIHFLSFGRVYLRERDTHREESETFSPRFSLVVVERCIFISNDHHSSFHTLAVSFSLSWLLFSLSFLSPPLLAWRYSFSFPW